MAEPFRITRTNTKRYIGTCDLCDFTTDVISIRATCAVRLRDHARIVHNMRAPELNRHMEPPRSRQRREREMKSPNKELPPMERLSEYEGHLCVFGAVGIGETKSQFGTSVVDCLVWVYNKGAWKALGETPIFWPNVGRELLREIGPDSETPEETMGAFLRKGGHPTQKGDFYWLDIAQDKAELALLKEWSKDYAESF